MAALSGSRSSVRSLCVIATRRPVQSSFSFCVCCFGNLVGYYTVGRQCGIFTHRAFFGAYTRPFFTQALIGTIAANWMPMRSSIIRATCGIGIAHSSRFSRLQSAWRRRGQSFCSGTHRQNCIVPPNNSMERTRLYVLVSIRTPLGRVADPVVQWHQHDEQSFSSPDPRQFGHVTR